MSTAEVRETIKLLSDPLTRPISELSLLRQFAAVRRSARLAYFRDDIVREAVAAVGFEEAQYYENDGAQAYIFKHHMTRSSHVAVPNLANGMT